MTFGPDGELVSDRTLERREGLGSPDVFGRFADGTLVVRDAPSHSRTRAGTLNQDTAEVALYDSDGRFRHHITRRPGRLLFAYETPGMAHLSPLHFGAVPVEAVGDSVILLHDGVSSTIELLTRTGAPHGTLHLGMRAVSPLGEELAAYRRNLLDAAQTPEQRRVARLRLDVVPFAKLKPTLSRILVDPAGDVWALRFQTDREGPSRWAVFRNGRLLGDVEVPAGVTALSINGPRLVGRWRDDLGVEHVRVHALIRRSATGPVGSGMALVLEDGSPTGSIPVSQILGDSQPRGRYYFTMRLAKSDRTFEISSGEAVLER